MTVSELTTGVTQRTTLVVLLAALGGGWLGGAAGALGVLAGGALALVSFRLLTARLLAVAAAETPRAPWPVLAGLRFAVVAGVAAMLFVSGWAHPVAWLVGYTALPLAVILQGLRRAGEESRA
jgi:hypothetical protein